MAFLRAVCPTWLRVRLARHSWQREQDALKAGLVDRDDFPWSVQASAAEGRPQEADPAGRPLLRLIGGLDISFFSDGGHPNDDRACVALIVCELDRGKDEVVVVWKDFVFIRMTEPYIAGFLAFREAPHYCGMLRRLAAERPDLIPDVVLVDGNGVLHPRGFGVASHVGVISGHVTVGVAKNLHMVDGLDRDAVKERCAAAAAAASASGGDAGWRDSFVPLVGASGRTWGAAVVPQPRKQAGPKRANLAPKNPIFVSIGHRISLESCVEVVRLCFLGARVPEPVRLADLLSREQVRLAREQETRDGPAVGRQLAHRHGSAALFVLAATGVAGLVLLSLRKRWLGLRL